MDQGAKCKIFKPYKVLQESLGECLVKLNKGKDFLTVSKGTDAIKDL